MVSVERRIQSGLALGFKIGDNLDALSLLTLHESSGVLVVAFAVDIGIGDYEVTGSCLVWASV